MLLVATPAGSRGHLDSSDKLLDHIQSNLITLSAHGLTKADIYANHRNMYLLFNKTDTYDAYSQKDEACDHAKDIIEKCPPRNGWCCWGSTTNVIVLNNQQLRITCLVWGGAEECPIEKHFSDKYHGHSRAYYSGYRDWFVTNLTSRMQMWIPDLLPAQITMFGFSQSANLPYHLDLEKYITIMGLSRKGLRKGGPFGKTI